MHPKKRIRFFVLFASFRVREHENKIQYEFPNSFFIPISKVSEKTVLELFQELSFDTDLFADSSDLRDAVQTPSDPLCRVEGCSSKGFVAFDGPWN